MRSGVHARTVTFRFFKLYLISYRRISLWPLSHTSQRLAGRGGGERRSSAGMVQCYSGSNEDGNMRSVEIREVCCASKGKDGQAGGV